MKLIHRTILIFALILQHSNAQAIELEANGGLGLAIKSDNTYSGVGEVGLGIGSWKTAVSVFGHSESSVEEINVLGGELYTFHLNKSKTLEGGIGVGALYTQTSADGTTGKMANIAWPIRLDWQFAKFAKFTANAKWTSWLFFPSYIPALELLSHDRISTVSVSAGVEL